MPLNPKQYRAVERVEILDANMVAILSTKSPGDRSPRVPRDVAIRPRHDSQFTQIRTSRLVYRSDSEGDGEETSPWSTLSYSLCSETFDRLQLRYAVTGSTATIAYGEPRFTNDINVLVELSEERGADFLQAFPAASFTSVRLRCVRRRRIDVSSSSFTPLGLQADVIIASNSEFNSQRLDRSRPLAVLPNRTVLFATPEDVILKKLQYFKKKARTSTYATSPAFSEYRGRGYRLRSIEGDAPLGVGEIWSLLRKQLGENGREVTHRSDISAAFSRKALTGEPTAWSGHKLCGRPLGRLGSD